MNLYLVAEYFVEVALIIFETKQIFISVVLHSIDTIKEDEKAPFVHLSFKAEEKELVFTCSATTSDEFTGFGNGVERTYTKP
jgi:hypothetical protein